MKRDEALKLFGFNKFESKCLMHLLKHGESMAREIERATRLRQPEVSMGLTSLNKKGFVDFKKLKGKKRGRPKQIYYMKMSNDKFIEYLKKDAEKKKKEIDRALSIVLGYLEKTKKKGKEGKEEA